VTFCSSKIRAIENFYFLTFEVEKLIIIVRKTLQKLNSADFVTLTNSPAWREDGFGLHVDVIEIKRDGRQRRMLMLRVLEK